MMILDKINRWLFLRWRWYRNLRLFVIADATDNSISFSKCLFRLLDVYSHEQAKVFVFSVECGGPDGKHYAFMLNPDFDQETQLADIQFNVKHKTVGFESLCPSVNRIFYDYGIPADRRAKLSVDICFNPYSGIEYYKILKPYDRHRQ